MLYPLTMLGFEASSVIQKRLALIGRGGPRSFDEMCLMWTEKMSAAAETMIDTLRGQTGAGTIAFLRRRVAENEARLTS